MKYLSLDGLKTIYNGILSKIDKKIDGIEIGGKNLLSETNQGTKHWAWTMGTAGYTKESVFENGINTCKLIRNNDENTGWSVIVYDGLVKSKLKPNSYYTLSFDVKTNSVNSGKFELRLVNTSSQNNLVAHMSSSSVMPNSEWQTVVFHMQLLNTFPAGYDQVVYLLGMDSSPNIWYQFRNIKLEKGTKATDWTPAPEDDYIPHMNDQLNYGYLRKNLVDCDTLFEKCADNATGTSHKYENGELKITRVANINSGIYYYDELYAAMKNKDLRLSFDAKTEATGMKLQICINNSVRYESPEIASSYTRYTMKIHAYDASTSIIIYGNEVGGDVYIKNLMVTDIDDTDVHYTAYAKSNVDLTSEMKALEKRIAALEAK